MEYAFRLFRFFCIALIGACVLTVLNVVAVTSVLVTLAYIFR